MAKLTKLFKKYTKLSFKAIFGSEKSKF